MSLPVSIGPNRCELIYNHDKQPLLELSLRVCLPVKELLHMLSQLAPPANRQTSKQQRPIVKSPPSECKRKDVDTPAKAQPPVQQSHLPQGSSSSNWKPSYHPWEQKLWLSKWPFPASLVLPWCLSGCPQAVLCRRSARFASQAVQLVLSCLPGASQAVQLVLSCFPRASLVPPRLSNSLSCLPGASLAPPTAVAWPDEWASSNRQVEEQAQLLWAVSDRALPR